ncbi:MAG: PEGA domain-containing protein, partial [Alistipes sp.]|nr:PEGA domain-containing protein [Alistipes sp.]
MLLSAIVGLFSASTAAAKKPIRTPEYQWSISVASEPAGAQVYYNGEQVCASTPGTVSIPVCGEITPDKKNMERAYAEAKRKSSIKLTFLKEGYTPVEKVLEPSVSFQKAGFLKQYLFDWPKVVNVKLNADPNGPYASDPTIPAGEARNRVSREKAGQSELERTIVRWYFDSDPRGARIFWRVISSVPA